MKRKVAMQLISIPLNLGMTQEQFADYLGMKQSLISQLENGEQNITISTLQKIARRVGASVNVDISLEESATREKEY